MSKRDSAEARFWQKVNKTEGCWLWTAGLNVHGYGCFWSGSRQMGAHRWAYEYFVGVVPAGLELDHLCRVRHCVNPDHLEPVSHIENARRGDTGLHAREKAARITECPHGHEYTSDNLYIGPQGDRQCRTCRRAGDRVWVRKAQAASASGATRTGLPWSANEMALAMDRSLSNRQVAERANRSFWAVVAVRRKLAAARRTGGERV